MQSRVVNYRLRLDRGHQLINMQQNKPLEALVMIDQSIELIHAAPAI